MSSPLLKHAAAASLALLAATAIPAHAAPYMIVGNDEKPGTDAQGNRTWNFYDADGRQTFVVRGVADGNGVRNALGEVTETRYSAFGQVTDRIAYTNRLTIPTPGSRASALAALCSAVAPAANARIANAMRIPRP